MLQELDTESKKVGPTMNTTKTKLMTNSTKDQVEIDGNIITYVDEYDYLGQIISTKDQTDKEIERRVTNSWRKFWSLKEVLKSKEIDIKYKFKVLNMCIVPVITYGCQSWSLTKKHFKKLDVCQNSMERSVLNIKLKDKVKLTTIKSKSKTKKVTDIVKQQKWRWTGHMMREKIDKWTKDIVEWYPREGKRKKGRPYLRWEDNFKYVAGGAWRQIAKDRVTWKSLEEAYVLGQAEDTKY